MQLCAHLMGMDSRLDLNIDSRMLQKGSGEGTQKPRACWGILAVLGTHLPKSRVIIQLSLCERPVGSGVSPSAGLYSVRTWEVTQAWHKQISPGLPKPGVLSKQ